MLHIDNLTGQDRRDLLYPKDVLDRAITPLNVLNRNALLLNLSDPIFLSFGLIILERLQRV